MGANMVSTGVTKPMVHVEDVFSSLNKYKPIITGKDKQPRVAANNASFVNFPKEAVAKAA